MALFRPRREPCAGEAPPRWPGRCVTAWPGVPWAGLGRGGRWAAWGTLKAQLAPKVLRGPLTEAGGQPFTLDRGRWTWRLCPGACVGPHSCPGCVLVAGCAPGHQGPLGASAEGAWPAVPGPPCSFTVSFLKLPRHLSLQSCARSGFLPASGEESVSGFRLPQTFHSDCIQ